MTTATIRQPRSGLSLLSLVVAGAAATIAVGAIVTDDVSNPSPAPAVARQAPVEVPLDQTHPAAAPENARPKAVPAERPQLNPYVPPRGEDLRFVERESLPFIPYAPQREPVGEDERLADRVFDISPFVPFAPQPEPVVTGAPVTRG
jgi:hypothetical protein